MNPRMRSMMEAKVTLEQLRAHSDRIPFNAWMGLELIACSADSVQLRVPWRVEFAGSPGMTHGGILASLVDATAYMVLMVVNGSGGPTVDMRIDYHRSTANGTVHVMGKLTRAGATISTVDVQIHDAEGRVIASGRCVYLSQPRRRSPELCPAPRSIP